MTIEIIVGFDGSCPQSSRAVKRIGKSKFIIYPGYRRIKNGLGEEIPGKGSRFSTKVVNHDKSASSVELDVDWETNDRTEHHDIGYIRHESEDDWTMIAGLRNGTKIIYRFKVKPGVTQTALFPEYNYEMCRQFASFLAGKSIKVKVIGHSREKRDIYLASFPSSNPNAKTYLVHARDHGYESAGSYCVEGIADFLMTPTPLCEYLRSKFHVLMIPMANPDGVHNGMSSRTWERGPKLDMAYEDPDPSYFTVKNAIDRIKPNVYMNLHNWTFKFKDGIVYGRDDELVNSIQQFMPADTAHYKQWHVIKTEYEKFKKKQWLVPLTKSWPPAKDRPESMEDVRTALEARALPIESNYTLIREQFKIALTEITTAWINYCEEFYDTTGAAFEFPWFSLNTSEMKEKGKKAFIALALAAIQHRRW